VARNFVAIRMKKKDNRESGTLILRLGAGADQLVDCPKVEESLKGIEGILDAQVNCFSHMVRIEFDPRKLTFEQVGSALDTLRLDEAHFRTDGASGRSRRASGKLRHQNTKPSQDLKLRRFSLH